MRLIIDILEPSPTLLKGAPISVFSVFGCFRKTYLFRKNLNWCASQIIKTLHPSHSFGSSGYWQCPLSSMYSNRSSVWPQKKSVKYPKKGAFYHQFRTHGIWNSNPLKTHQARATQGGLFVFGALLRRVVSLAKHDIGGKCQFCGGLRTEKKRSWGGSNLN